MHATGTEARRMLIGGKWVANSRTYPVRLPWDQSVRAMVHEAEPSDVERAVQAAAEAAPGLRALSNSERSDLLLRVRELLLRDSGLVAETVACESGKPIREARLEVDRATHTLMAAAVAARDLTGETVPMEGGRWAMTVREPLGVIGAITPWNFPVNLAMHKVAPAIGSGNTVVHKPSENTPLSALELARLFTEAGCPPGAYNVVTGGPDVGRCLVRDPRVRMITFTGSVEAGSDIRSNAGLKRVTLELGGNCPVIVEPDADLELAASRSVTGAFANSGQVCISVQRIYVHESLADRFLERFAALTSKLRIGHPLDENTEISSMISEEEAVRVEDWIADAVAKGAKRVQGGERRGATVTPCILAEVPESARLSCNEVFGPVVAVNRYGQLDDAITQANATMYGLQAGIFTRDLQRAFDAARRLESGGILINDVPTFRADAMPYGGTKNSGVGREGPRYAMEEMTEPKLICWR